MHGWWTPRRLAGLLAAIAQAHGQISISTAGLPFRVEAPDGPLGADGLVRGVGVDNGDYWRQASDYGADTVRTYSLQNLPASLSRAAQEGLRVHAGIFISVDPAQYTDCGDLEASAYWQGERDRIVAAVAQSKGSPQLLWWTIGNEVPHYLDSSLFECHFRRLEWLVQAVKVEDPNHPVGTVVNRPEDSVAQLVAHAASLDFVGVNAYGSAVASVSGTLLEAGWTKPWVLAEYGASGWWAMPATSWGAPTEQTSDEKAVFFLEHYDACVSDPRCVGAFPFLWDWKWEATPTWFSLFNAWTAVNAGCVGCEASPVAALQERWTGQARTVAPPTITDLFVGGVRLDPALRSFVLPLGAPAAVRVEASQAQARPLTALWAVTRDGAVTEGNMLTPRGLMAGAWAGGEQTVSGLTGTLAALPIGAYRLYVFVREAGSGAAQEATATAPFFVCPSPGEPAGLDCSQCHTATEDDECYSHVNWVMQVGVAQHPDWYPGLTTESTFEDVQTHLHNSAQSNQYCPQLPCEYGCRWDLQEVCYPGCGTPAPGDACDNAVTWAKDVGVSQNPEWYPGLDASSTFDEFQLLLHGTNPGDPPPNCPLPCSWYWWPTRIESPSATTSATATVTEPAAAGNTTSATATTTSASVAATSATATVTESAAAGTTTSATGTTTSETSAGGTDGYHTSGVTGSSRGARCAPLVALAAALLSSVAGL